MTLFLNTDRALFDHYVWQQDLDSPIWKFIYILLRTKTLQYTFKVATKCRIYMLLPDVYSVGFLYKILVAFQTFS